MKSSIIKRIYCLLGFHDWTVRSSETSEDFYSGELWSHREIVEQCEACSKVRFRVSPPAYMIRIR